MARVGGDSVDFSGVRYSWAPYLHVHLIEMASGLVLRGNFSNTG